MKPKTLSASSILVSEACMKRWEVENFQKAPRTSSTPANVGLSVHFGLEHFVKAVYLDEKIEWGDLSYLKSMYQMGYMETFQSANLETPEYQDGLKMVLNWHKTYADGLPNKVLSVETKENFMIPTSVGDIPFNYIFDRLDEMNENEYEVVDYKTLRAPIKDPEELKRKIQPRAYALAIQIKYPQAKRIWVTFDMLRYSPVGVCFTREENKATWKMLKRAAERIIAVEEGEAQETLNDECKWCIRKLQCETLLRAGEAGMGIGLELEQIAEKKLRVQQALEGLKWAETELDKLLVAEAEARDESEFEVGDYEIEIKTSSRRKVNSNAVSHILGPELSAKYANFTVKTIDDLLESGEITEEQSKKIKNQISKTWSDPSPKVKAKFDV